MFQASVLIECISFTNGICSSKLRMHQPCICSMQMLLYLHFQRKYKVVVCCKRVVVFNWHLLMRFQNVLFTFHRRTCTRALLGESIARTLLFFHVQSCMYCDKKYTLLSWLLCTCHFSLAFRLCPMSPCMSRNVVVTSKRIVCTVSKDFCFIEPCVLKVM